VKTVLAKLGVKPGEAFAVIGAPGELATLFEGMGNPGEAQHRIAFVPNRAAAPAAIADGLAWFAPGRRLWFAYPKKSGAHASDISRDHGWDALAEAGFLGVTQIAIDDDWSALRFRPRSEIAKLTRKSELQT
jgi:hypothetical protein